MIDEATKKRVKEIFSDWLEIQDSRRVMTKSANDLKKEAADLLEIKSTNITKIFGFMKKLWEDGDDELEDIVTVFEVIKD